VKPLHYLWYPPKAAPQAPHPLIVFLHGIGERGEDLELVKKWGLPRFTESGEITLPACIAAPQCPAEVRWDGVIDGLDAMLDELLAQHPIDADRVYLTGFSMGGFGTWQWASRSLERFAALMPVGGSALPDPADLERMKQTPIWMVHSALDQAVPVKGADEVAAALAALGSNFGYTRYPDATHGGTSDRAFSDKALYRWLLAQKREKS
jgi:predicted peptidase